MGTVPTPESWTDGEQMTYDLLQRRLTTVQNFLLHPPQLKLRKTTSLSVATSTPTLISWSVAEVDTDNMWGPPDLTKIIPKTPGWYVGTVSVQMGLTSSNPTSGDRYVMVLRNGDATDKMAAFNRLPAPGIVNKPLTYADFPLFHYFNGTTDYLTVTVNQTTGANLTMFASGNNTLDLRWFCA